jgi:hypothetical protein
MRKHILSVLAALVLAGGGLTFFLGSSKAGPIEDGCCYAYDKKMNCDCSMPDPYIRCCAICN